MGKRIIVVDDSKEVSRMLMAALTGLQANLTVQAFISAEEALLEASRSAVDVLVSDLRLPGKSGVELAREMRQKRPDLRVIFITGLSDQEMLRQARAIEADGFFQKPIKMTAFLEAVNAALEKCGETKADTAPLNGKAVNPQRARRATGALRPVGGDSQSVRPRRVSSPTRLSEAITALRQRLGAQAVFVLDERGRVVELAGELPGADFEQDWAPRVMGAISAAQKAARLVGEAPAPLVIGLQGSEYHLALAPLEHFALILLLKPGRASLRLGLAVEEALLAQTTLLELLRQMGVAGTLEPPALAEPAPVPETAQPAALSEEPVEQLVTIPPVMAETEPKLIEEPALDDFLEKLDATAQAVSREKADAFWDELTNGQSLPPQNPDDITYDQARQLGLAPRDDKG